LRKHPKRVSAREFLPWFGLLATLSLCFLQTGLALILPGCYLAVLMIEGLRSSIMSKRISPFFGVPFCLIMLHSSFSIGLLDGLLRKGRASSDR